MKEELVGNQKNGKIDNRGRAFVGETKADAAAACRKEPRRDKRWETEQKVPGQAGWRRAAEFGGEVNIGVEHQQELSNWSGPWGCRPLERQELDRFLF